MDKNSAESAHPQQNRTSGVGLDSDPCTTAGTSSFPNTHKYTHTRFTHLISRVPDEALPIACDGDELVGMIRDKFTPEQLALRVDLKSELNGVRYRLVGENVVVIHHGRVKLSILEFSTARYV